MITILHRKYVVVGLAIFFLFLTACQSNIPSRTTTVSIPPTLPSTTIQPTATTAPWSALMPDPHVHQLAQSADFGLSIDPNTRIIASPDNTRLISFDSTQLELLSLQPNVTLIKTFPVTKYPDITWFPDSSGYLVDNQITLLFISRTGDTTTIPYGFAQVSPSSDMLAVADPNNINIYPVSHGTIQMDPIHTISGHYSLLGWWQDSNVIFLDNKTLKRYNSNSNTVTTYETLPSNTGYETYPNPTSPDGSALAFFDTLNNMLYTFSDHGLQKWGIIISAYSWYDIHDLVYMNGTEQLILLDTHQNTRTTLSVKVAQLSFALSGQWVEWQDSPNHGLLLTNAFTGKSISIEKGLLDQMPFSIFPEGDGSFYVFYNNQLYQITPS